MHSVAIGTHRLPLEVLKVWSLWLQILLIQDAWMRSCLWLQKVTSSDSDPDHANLVECIGSSLDSLCWSESLGGFDHACGVGVLSRVISSEWLSSENIDTLLKLLQDDATCLGVSMHFLESYQVQYLAKLEDKALSNKSYCYISSPGTRLGIRELGERLLNGNTRYIAGIANLGGVHWVAFVIDGCQKTIWIGDSLKSGNSLLSSKYSGLISSLRWWIKQLSDCLGLPSTYFECKELKINSQADSDSCGIFAHNALHHFISPEVPLLVAPLAVDLWLRLGFLMLNHHNQALAPVRSCFMCLESHLIGQPVICRSKVQSWPNSFAGQAGC
jgi:hypothetical protein